MPNTGSNFVLVQGSTGVLQGSTVTTPPFVQQMNPVGAMNEINTATSPAVPLDRVLVDLALTSAPAPIGSTILPIGLMLGGYAKTGCLYVTFTGTTPVTIDLTAMATAVGVTSSQSNDTSLATVNVIVFRNLSTTGTITIAPGGSNPSDLPKFSGTTPTISTKAGGGHVAFDIIGTTVDATHKTILLTPSAGGAMAISYGGA